jgi:hypothetical protein
MKTKKLLFYLLAGILGGCIPVMSLHPLYTKEKEEVVFENKLLGTWVDDPNSPKTTWEFKRADANENAYRLIYSVEKGEKGLFVAHLVKLKDKLFLDVHLGESPADMIEKQNRTEVPGKVKDPNRFDSWLYNTILLIPVHTFIKIDSIDPNLTMRLTDDEKMNKLFEQDPNAVEHTSIEDNDSLVLTASTQKLQAFVLKYADDDRVFSNEVVLTRKKTKAPQESAEQKPNEPNDPNKG